MKRYYQAKADDFKGGLILIDSEGNFHKLDKLADGLSGIWECKNSPKIIFENEARFYKIFEERK